MANGLALNNEIPNQSLEVPEMVDMFLEELAAFVKQYDFLGSVRYEEYREFNHIEHDYFVKNINNMSPLELIPTIKAIEEHMKEFSKSNGILKFYLKTFILFE